MVVESYSPPAQDLPESSKMSPSLPRRSSDQLSFALIRRATEAMIDVSEAFAGLGLVTNPKQIVASIASHASTHTLRDGVVYEHQLEADDHPAITSKQKLL